jgi:hypothetical protein
MTSGGCQCGAVRYRFTGPMGRASICHCRMCQKAFGSFGAPLVSVPLSAFSWTRGAPGIFRSSAPVARGFCAACGTPLFMLEDGHPDIELAIGTLDDPNAVTLEGQVGVESKLAWFDGMPQLPPETTDQNNPAAARLYHTRQHPDHDTEQWP